MSSFLIDHFDLYGLRQVYLHLRGQPYTHYPFVARSLYRVIHHPLMAGFLIAMCATPAMSLGHMLSAAGMTVYVLVGIQVEERDLMRMLGDDY